MDFTGLLLSIFLSTALIRCSAAQTDAGDVVAMHALSRGLGADRSLGWSTSTAPCRRMVTCFGGRVASIQIGNQSLWWTLPSDIAKLTAVTRLELQLNRISGDLLPFANNNPFQPRQIPESLRNAASLVNFSANSANVSGQIPDFIATDFPSLTHLAPAFNLLSGIIPPSFAGSLIRSLWLNNQRGGAGAGASLSGWILFVQNMTGLEELWLHSNSFSGPLPDFSGLINLRDLRLRDNQLTGLCRRMLL